MNFRNQTLTLQRGARQNSQTVDKEIRNVIKLENTLILARIELSHLTVTVCKQHWAQNWSRIFLGTRDWNVSVHV